VTVALRRHWPEYVIEAVGLGAFMLSACLVGTLLEYPGSRARQALPDPLLRRVVMGLAMGLTAAGLIYSRWGRRSGAHFNPAVTLTFWRLGRVEPADALGYVVAQAAGAVAGVGVGALLLGGALRHPAVLYVATVPGPGGAVVAFAAETAIAFGLMLAVLATSSRPALARFTGLLAGALVAAYIVIEAPLSGMSMNPARTLGSAVHADVWTAWWVYLLAPPLGMLGAAALYRGRPGRPAVRCAKLQHDRVQRCIFRCGYAEES
jgi:aquaporin Z